MRDAFSDRKLLRRSLNFISDSIFNNYLALRYPRFRIDTHLKQVASFVVTMRVAPPIFFSLYLFKHLLVSDSLNLFYLSFFISGTAVCFFIFWLLFDLYSICETNRKLLFLDLHKLSSLPTLCLLRSIVGTSFVGQGHYGTRPCVHFIPM